MNTRDRTLIAVALSWVLAAAASAQSTQPQPPPTDTAAIAHVSGGVGEMDRARMQAMKDQYNLQLTFAVVKSGHYLANVPVSISNSAGKRVLQTVSEGPLLYAKLPPGSYSVTAQAPNGGKQLTESVRVPPRGAHAVTMHFPQ